MGRKKMSAKQGMIYTAITLIALVLALNWLGVLTVEVNEDVEIPGTDPQQSVDTSDLVSVTKQVKLVISDKHGGAPATGTTDSIDIYKEDKESTWETDLDLSSGTVTTAKTYPSGTTMYIRYYYDTTIDEYMWWKVTVPKMNRVDAESATTQTMNLEAFSEPAATDLLHLGTTAKADAGNINVTGSTYDTGTLKYSWSITNDNTGFISSYDPTYGKTFKAILWGSLTGTGYETCSLSGWDGSFTLGSTRYYYDILSDSEVSKWAKTSTGYVEGYEGEGVKTFTYDVTGYTGNATTLQLTLSLYADYNYMLDHGAWGPYVFTLCESTLYFYQL